MIIRPAVVVTGGRLLLQVFSSLASDQPFPIAVMLYFFCPPALVLPMSVEGSVKKPQGGYAVEICRDYHSVCFNDSVSGSFPKIKFRLQP